MTKPPIYGVKKIVCFMSKKSTRKGFIVFILILNFFHLPVHSQGLHGYIGSYTSQAPSKYGERSWTLFLNSQNFKGPLAYYLPETWAKISKDYPFDHLNILMHTIPNSNSRLQIMDMNGRIIQTTYLKKSREELNIKSLSKGIYILIFSDGDHFERIKFIKTE